MINSFFVVVTSEWLSRADTLRDLHDHKCPLGPAIPNLDDHCQLFVKYRAAGTGYIVADSGDARLQNQRRGLIASPALAEPEFDSVEGTLGLGSA